MTSARRAGESPAADAAAALMDALVTLGVRHVVVSPGSRSQALALAAAELESTGRIRLHVRTDERSAGFTALGIGRETGVPAAVVCTSGTAVANLLPAVLEAHHSGVPLLLLTADRPPELRGVGANQTTAQSGIFGAAVRLAEDAAVPDGSEAELYEIGGLAVRAFVAATRGRPEDGAGAPGPVHLNLPYREPLAGPMPAWFRSASDGGTERDPGRVGEASRTSRGPSASQAAAVAREAAALVPSPADPLVLEPGPRTVVVAGADAGPDAEELSDRGMWPLIAEVVSGARFGRRLVHGYREALRDADLGGRIERAVVFGHPTLTREVTALLSRRDVDVIAVRRGGEPLNLNGATTQVDAVDVASRTANRVESNSVVQGLVEGAAASQRRSERTDGRSAEDRSDPHDEVPSAAEHGWFGAWSRHSCEYAAGLGVAASDTNDQHLNDSGPRPEGHGSGAAPAPIDREQLVAAVWQASRPEDRLMFGSSRLVRVADAVLGGGEVVVHSNRGLAGIDGTVATGIGIAVASQEDRATGVTRVLLGDLALLHDAGSLLLPEAESAPRIQVIVGNDGGGTIFDELEVASVADPAAMERVQYTPQTVDLAALAAAYGWEHVRVTTRPDLDRALLAPVTRPRLIEAPLSR